MASAHSAPRVDDDSLRTLFSSLATPSSETIRQSVREKLFAGVPENARIGRYIIQRHLGSGGMGAVYLAHDCKLRRPVALKLLHQCDARPASLERRRRRLLREAQGLARLSHPNVVQVHDVDTHGEHLFLVMDHVDGSTLKEWLEAPRSWRAIVEVFRQAGEGLAAAHSAGLIHRDFKPSNVLIGANGRAQVIDFGLVRVDELTTTTEERESVTEEPELDALPDNDELTAPGAVLGTLAYIAPEIFSGFAADARADVYSFCVSLFEALYGVRPFRADSRDLLICRIIEGAIQEPPANPRIPRWLHRVCLRGLATDPARRYPTMAALLADLSPSRQLRRRLVPAFAGLVGALLTAGMVANVAARSELCGAAAPLWDASDRAAVRTSLSAAGVADPERAWSRIDDLLSAHARERDAVAASLCAEPATRIASTAISRRCLAMVAADHRDVIDRIRRGELVAITTLVDDPTSLPSPAICLRPDEAGDADTADTVGALADALADANSLSEDGRYAEALSAVKAAQVAAEDAGAALQEALAWHLRGRIEAILGDSAGTESLAMAQMLATRAGDDDLARRAQIDRARALASLRGNANEADAWIERAGPGVGEGLGPLDAANLSAALAEVARVRGDLDGARRHGERVLRIRERLLGQDHPLVSEAVHNLAASADLAGDSAAAIELYRRALALRERTLRPDHPAIAATLTSLASALADAGVADAEVDAAFARALEIDRAAFGEAHPRVATILHDWGVAARQRGDDELAYSRYTEALAIRRRSLGAGHPAVADTLNAMAIVDKRRGELGRALAEYQDALEIRERALGEDHPAVASTLASLANLHLGRGDPAAALAPLARAQAIYESMGPSGEVDLAWVLRLRGKSELLLGHPGAARPLAERALILDRATLSAPGQAAELARAEALLAELDGLAS